MGVFLFFFSKYHHGLFVSHVFVVVTVLVFQCAAKFISFTEIHTYVINEKKNCSIFLLALTCTYSFLCFFVITSLKSWILQSQIDPPGCFLYVFLPSFSHGTLLFLFVSKEDRTTENWNVLPKPKCNVFLYFSRCIFSWRFLTIITEFGVWQ